MKKTTLFLVIFAAVIFAGYRLYGHALIQAVYEGRSIWFLNSMIEGQKTWPLAAYRETGDAMMFSLAGMALISFFLVKFLRSGQGRDERGCWRIAGALVFLIVSAACFRPSFGENELVYLINPKRLMDPGFLANDWTWQMASHGHFIFDLVTSPLTLVLSDLKLALIGRLLAWTLLIGSLIRLARTLQLKWWSFALGFAFWFYAGQSLAGGEWVFSGFEAKCFSYVFLFLALKDVLEEKLVRSAIFCGLSISFHVLVGGWGTLGVLASFFGLNRRPRLGKILILGFTAFLFGLPGLAASGFNLARSGAMSDGNYAIDVFFRGPHHLDPCSFLPAKGVVEILIYTALTAFILWKALKREPARVLLLFLAAELGVFTLGLGARRLNLLSFLYLYPFRLGPLFLLLFFSLGVVRFLEVSLRAKEGRVRFVGMAVLLFSLFQVWDHRMPRTLLNSAADSVVSWKRRFLKIDEDNFSKAAVWIRQRTASDSVFVAPPWEYRFWLFAQRAQVVSYKTIPVNTSNQEWLLRLTDLNGGLAFREKGGAALNELKENYPRLSLGQLRKIHSRYQARYYLTVEERRDLPLPLLYSNPSYYLYDLQPSP